ncbi:hypothetical protein BDW75DRAFT_197395 [Aspergillus navahoensis]
MIETNRNRLMGRKKGIKAKFIPKRIFKRVTRNSSHFQTKIEEDSTRSTQCDDEISLGKSITVELPLSVHHHCLTVALYT